MISSAIRNNYKKLFLLIVPVIVCLVYLSTDRLAERFLVGYLYFGSGSYLGRYDLSDGSSAVISNLGDVDIRHISAYPGDWLLLTVSGPVNDRVVSRVIRYHPGTGEERALFAGNSAHYIPGSGAIAFDSGTRLVSIGTDRRAHPESSIQAHNRVNGSDVVALAENQILYARQLPDNASIWLRDVVSGRERQLDGLGSVCRIDGALWVDDLDALLCVGRAAGPSTYTLVSLEGEIIGNVELSGANAPKALAYLTGQHAIVFTDAEQSWASSSDNYPVWVYDLDNQRSYKLSEDQFLGSSVAFKRQ